MNRRLQGDCALRAASQLLSVVQSAIREEEYRDFFDEAFRICVDLLTDYETQAVRQAERLVQPSPFPTNNHEVNS